MYILFIISSFLLLSVPMFSGIIVSLYFKWDFNSDRFKKVFFMGIFFYVIAQIILLLVGLFFRIDYDKSSFYIYLWITEFLILILTALAGYLLMLSRGFFRQDSYREFPFIFSYVSGFLSLAGLTKIVNSLFKFDAYILFIYPVICIALLLFFSIIIIEAGTRRGYISILIYSLLIPLSLILPLAPWFYYLNYFPAVIGVSLVSFFSAGALFFILKKDYTGK
ncbi:MAG: hypothetical protein KAQ93_02330 [Spirochaetales bacterium]|nr:hypothetical protein [Spirochaetales bacterium]